MPEISVITVALDNIAGLQRTYHSLKAQRFSDFEWVVIDGASTDGTVEYLSELMDDRVLWTSEPDEGLYDAMNKGLARSTGRYLYFLNSGDELFDGNVLDEVYQAIQANDSPDFLYGDAYERDAMGTLYLKRARSHRWIWYGMFTHHQAMFYSRRIAEMEKYDLSYPIGADYAFTVRTLKRAQRVYRMRDPICVFEHGGISMQNEVQGSRDQWRIRREEMGLPMVICALIRALHHVAHKARAIFPAIYNRLRYS